MSQTFPKIPEKQSRIVNAAFYLLIASTLFLAVTFLTDSDVKNITNPAQLDGFDFSSRIATLAPGLFDIHPHALYTPEDFAADRTTESVNHISINPRYVTYRLVLDNLTPGVVYGLSGLSATHAMTLWVDGVNLAQAGIPGNSYEAMTAGTNYFTAYFTAEAQTAEIIIQRSSFVLYHGGRLNPLYFGEQLLITSMNVLAHVRVSVILGITLMAALLYLGIFLFFKNRMWHLWFSLVCLMIALRTIGIDNRLIATLLPNLDWRLDYLIAYIITSGFIVFLVLYLDAMFENKTNRALKLGGIAILAAHSVFMLLTPPIVYSRFNTQYNIFLVLFTGAIMVNMAVIVVKHREMRRVEHILVLFGCAANIALGFGEAALRAATPQAAVNFTQIGTMIFMFINTIALAIHFRRTESELAKAEEQRRTLAAERTAMEKLYRMKTEFLATVSHELKTPLTIMGGYAQLTEQQLDTGTVNEKTKEKQQYIFIETQRLSQLVDKLLDLSIEDAGASDDISADVEGAIHRVLAICQPILEKNNNRLDTQIEQGCPYVAASPDMILQVLVNLATNANRHVKDDAITITAKQDGDMILFRVEDRGDGIPPQLLGSVFDRGVSGDGGTGFGLFVCKENIEAHGGEINIESKQGKGTTVCFTLPMHKEEDEA